MFSCHHILPTTLSHLTKRTFTSLWLVKHSWLKFHHKVSRGSWTWKSSQPDIQDCTFPLHFNCQDGGSFFWVDTADDDFIIMCARPAKNHAVLVPAAHFELHCNHSTDCQVEWVQVAHGPNLLGDMQRLLNLFFATSGAADLQPAQLL